MSDAQEQHRDRELLATAQRLAAVGGWEYDIQRETLSCTDEVTRLCGQPASNELTLSTTIEQFHPSDQPAVRAAIDGAINAGEGFEGEWRLQPEDDDQRWVRVYGEPEEQNGAVVRVRGAIEDITAEKQHKQRLNRLFETNRKLFGQDTTDAVASVAVDAARGVLGLSLCGIHLYDADDNVLAPVATTDATVEAFGEPPAFGPGDSIAWETFETGEPHVYDDIQAADTVHNPDTAIRSELLLPLGDHGVFIASSPQAGAFDDRTVSMGKILAADVEAALDQLDQKQQLRETNERLAEFANIVSHDLRNPLSVAKAGVEVAQRGAGDGDSLERVERAHDRMATLIDDLLTLAQDGEDLDEDALESVSLPAVAADAWDGVATDDAALAVPATDSIVADRSRLRQLLENLFRNSIEHGSPGDRSQAVDAEPAVDDTEPAVDDVDHDAAVTVRVGDLPDGFYVEDNGPGIDPDDRETVFEPGYTTHDEGTGFGLRIVRTVAAAHDWDVSVTDGTAGGARFVFSDVETRLN
ncbi:ATP-binding protein [Halonotius sp. GCM10025705]|uniref:ATP-binding protein n=1 Tax=Halonotius sp. GCM10025705 TaxID=3252678 RepID=UPI00360FF61D